MNKEKAALFLGISERTLERHKSAGKVKFSMVKGKTRPVVDYSEAELARFKEILEAEAFAEPPLPESASAVVTPGTATPETSRAIVPIEPRGKRQVAGLSQNSEGMAQFMAEFMAQFEAARVDTVPIQEKTFLTVAEAAKLAGVSIGAIRGAIKSGQLKPRTDLGRGHRLIKDDLRNWKG